MDEFHEISTSSRSDTQLLQRFYEDCLLPAVPDVDELDSLDDIEECLRLKDGGKCGADNYHIFVACEGDKPVAGSIVDYLVEPNAGMVEYLVVSPGRRHTGLGTRLLRYSETAIAADARLARQEVAWIVAELDDPFRASLSESEIDPFTRAWIWHRWGYRMLDFPYIQPTLSPGKSPVETLLLAAKTLSSEFGESIPAAQVLAFLREYLKWAMRIQRPEGDSGFCAMAQWLGSIGEQIALTTLADYAGMDGRNPRLRIQEVMGPHDPELRAALGVYTTVFTDPTTAIPADEFRRALTPERRSGKPGWHYHLWSIYRPEATQCEGVASFFTMQSAGFGGYLGLVPPLRGSGHLHYLFARVERQMIEDATSARGLYVECAGQLERDIFVKPSFGFYELDVAYTQPVDSDVSTLSADRQLHLLYKPFGRVYRPPTLLTADFLDAMREIITAVYGVDDLLSSNAYVALKRSLAGHRHVPVVRQEHVRKNVSSPQRSGAPDPR